VVNNSIFLSREGEQLFQRGGLSRLTARCAKKVRNSGTISRGGGKRPACGCSSQLRMNVSFFLSSPAFSYFQNNWCWWKSWLGFTRTTLAFLYQVNFPSVISWRPNRVYKDFRKQSKLHNLNWQDVVVINLILTLQ
jgi:hypothetical protein